MKLMLFVVLGLTGLVACSTQKTARELPHENAAPAKIDVDPPSPLEIVEIPKPIPFPNQLKPLPELSPPPAAASPKQSVRDANAAARIEPNPTGFINAIQVWPYSPAALYQVYTSPGQTTDLVFQAGEQLTDVSVSDPVRWVVGDTSSGTGDAQQMHLIVKPIRAALKANLIVTTDRRSYYIELHSAPETWMAAVSWEYPSDRLRELKVLNQEYKKDRPVVAGVSLEKLQFRYEISGDQVSWRPLRAFDDGQKVYIQFPDSIMQDDMPPLFILGAKGEAEIVNYRVRAPYYIVDRLFDAAELRLGGKKDSKAVRIARTDLTKGRKWRRR